MSLENASSPCVGSIFVTIHKCVGSSGTIQNFMSHDSSSIQVLLNMRFIVMDSQVIKVNFFIYTCAGILLTSIYITQWVLATPTLIGT